MKSHAILKPKHTDTLVDHFSIFIFLLHIILSSSKITFYPRISKYFAASFCSQKKTYKKLHTDDKKILISIFCLHSFSLSLVLITVGKARKDKQETFENKPLVIAKPIVLNDNKIQTVTESDALESKIEKIALNDTNDTNDTPASG
jgi:hypothetical protein